MEMMTYNLFIQKYEEKLKSLGYAVKEYPVNVRLYSKNFFPEVGYGFTLSIALRGSRPDSDLSDTVAFMSQLESPVKDMKYIEFSGKDVNTFDQEFTRTMADYSNEFARAISAHQAALKNKTQQHT